MTQRLEGKSALITWSASNIGRANYVHADLDGTAEASRGLADAATELLGGRIDILVNSAGIFPPANTLTADPEMFDRVYANAA